MMSDFSLHDFDPNYSIDDDFFPQQDETVMNSLLESPSDDTPSRKRKRKVLQNLRRSDRKRVRPHNPGYIPDEDIDDRLRDGEDGGCDRDGANASSEHIRNIAPTIEKDPFRETMPPMIPFEQRNSTIGAARISVTATTSPMTSSQQSKTLAQTPKKSPLQAPTPPNSSNSGKRLSDSEIEARVVPHSPSMILKFSLPSTKVHSDIP